MKKFTLTIIAILMHIVVYSQIYGKFSLPHLLNSDEYNEYIGQKVKIPDGYGGDFHDVFVFEEFSIYAKKNKIYVIEKIKISSKKIIIYLKDENGNKFKARVNANQRKSYDAMTTCESFFLVDKFDNYKKECKALIDKRKFINKSGDTVAYISNAEFKYQYKQLPKLEYTITCIPSNKTFLSSDTVEAKHLCSQIGDVVLGTTKDTVAVVIGVHSSPMKYWYRSKFDGNVFAGNYYSVKDNFKRVGEVLTHPKVKHMFVIVDCDGNLYKVRNLTTNEISHHLIKDVDRNIFKEVLEGKYESVLNKVEKPSNSQIRYGKTKTISDDKNITKYSYVDNVIDIVIVGDSEAFTFVLKNVSDNSIKIIWNEAVFVNYDGSTSKIMHKGIKYSQREGDQPATTIIKGAKIEDIAVPTCNVRYSSILDEWVNDSMYPSRPYENPGQLRLMLPIQIKDVINEYIFVFDVKYMYKHPDLINM